MGPGWLALGKVLWKLLDNCKTENDVHNAKIVMMLSQVCKLICGIIRTEFINLQIDSKDFLRHLLL